MKLIRLWVTGQTLGFLCQTRVGNNTPCCVISYELVLASLDERTSAKALSLHKSSLDVSLDVCLDKQAEQVGTVGLDVRGFRVEIQGV